MRIGILGPLEVRDAAGSRLRHAAGPGIVEHRAGGYLLAVEPGDVDATQFEWLVGEGRGPWPAVTREPVRRCCAGRWTCGAARP